MFVDYAMPTSPRHMRSCFLGLRYLAAAPMISTFATAAAVCADMRQPQPCRHHLCKPQSCHCRCWYSMPGHWVRYLNLLFGKSPGLGLKMYQTRVLPTVQDATSEYIALAAQLLVCHVLAFICASLCIICLLLPTYHESQQLAACENWSCW